LCVVTLELPPLRERGDDPVLLAEHFLRQFCQARGRRTPKLSAAAKRRLAGHDWPGNVRELRNTMERIAFLTDGPTVQGEDVAIVARGPAPDAPGAAAIEGPLTEATYEFQRRHILRAIDRTRGNVAAAARDLGLHRSNLYRKMKQLGMEDGTAEEHG
ncbi:MAG: helix-turn-helix domain-containing protein, partial [Planctomycetota bacterium]